MQTELRFHCVKEYQKIEVVWRDMMGVLSQCTIVRTMVRSAYAIKVRSERNGA